MFVTSADIFEMTVHGQLFQMINMGPFALEQTIYKVYPY